MAKRTKPKRSPKKKSRVIRARPTLKLDLGSGQNPAEGFKGVDRAPVTDFQFDLTSGEPWPWADNSVDELRASHFIEHIRKDLIDHNKKWPWGRLKFWFFFDQAWRVAKHGALFHLIWPSCQNVRAYQDPEHVDYVPQERMLYLNRDWRKANALDHYDTEGHWAVTGVAPTIPNGPRFEGDQPIGQRAAPVQQRMFVECWGVIQDFHVVLKAMKE